MKLQNITSPIAQNQDILIRSAPDQAVDAVTLAVRNWLANHKPELNFACVRISEGNHSAIGIVWYHLKLLKSAEIDDYNLADFNIETGVFFAQAGIPKKSRQWLNDGVNHRRNGCFRFKPFVHRWAKKQIGSPDILIEL